MSDSIILRLAEAIAPDIPGIPWDQLEKEQGMIAADLVYSTAVPPNGTAPAWAYQNYILEAQKRAADIVATLDLPWELTTQQAGRAWLDVQTNTAEVGKAVLRSLEEDFYSVLGDDKALKVTVRDLGAIIANVYMAALYGAVIQLTEVMQKTNQPSEQIIGHAEQVTGAFNIIEIFLKEGMLEPLKKGAATQAPKATSGLPVAAPVLVVGGLVVVLISSAVIAAIAWTSIATKKIAATNGAMSGICEQAALTKNPEMVSACIKLSEINQVATEKPPDIGNSLERYLLVGVGVYMLITFGPAIARSLSETRRERAFGAA